MPVPFAPGVAFPRRLWHYWPVLATALPGTVIQTWKDALQS